MAAFTIGGGLGAELKSNSMPRIWRRFKRVTIDIFISFTHLEKMTFGPTTETFACAQFLRLFSSLTKMLFGLRNSFI